VPTVHSDKILM